MTRCSDPKCENVSGTKNLRGVWEEAMRAELKGLVGLNAFELVDVVPDGVNVVSARWVFAWKVDSSYLAKRFREHGSLSQAAAP